MKDHNECKIHLNIATENMILRSHIIRAREDMWFSYRVAD